MQNYKINIIATIMIANVGNRQNGKAQLPSKKLQVGGQIKSQANIKKYFEAKDNNGDTARNSEGKRISINSGMTITTSTK